MNKTPRFPDSKAMSPGMADILRTSCELMATKGFHGTSMRDLAHATGRSVSGLYHHFQGKEDLLFLINYHGFIRPETKSFLDHMVQLVADGNGLERRSECSGEFSPPRQQLQADVCGLARMLLDEYPDFL